ncbi:MAG TPA: hypothetical protein VK209_10895 [Candidatus Sulfotelmatobacter sp.]|nr:hypothetical protein [Candidatus Sulfotelmatobacter sp.]
MNKRPVLLLLFVTLLSSYIAVHSISVNAQTTDFISFPSGITVYSPLNMTYDSHYLFLNLTLQSAGQMGYLDPNINMNYSIDGDYNGAVSLTISNPGLHVVTNAAAYMSLPKLSEGSHYMTLYLFGNNQKSLYPKYLSYEDTVYFSVSMDASDTPPSGWVEPEVTSQDQQPQDVTPPKVTMLSPARNKSFEAVNLTSLEVSLNFTVNEAPSKLRFSLDGQPNATIAGNFTFRGLSAGLHNLTVYAWDSAGNVGASETVDFTITVMQEPETQSESSLILPVAASIVSIGVVTVAVMLYVKKRKR